MFKMKSTDAPTKTAADAVADEMRTALATLRKPAALELAERSLTAARAKRAEMAEEHADTLRDFRRRNPGASAPSAEVLANAAALASCDEAIKASRSKLAGAREAFTPSFRATIDEPLKDITAEMLAHLGELDRLVEALADARRYAERNGLEVPRLLDATHALRELVAGMRRAIR